LSDCFQLLCTYIKFFIMKKLFIFLSSLLFTMDCLAQPGQLDSSFGRNGVQSTSFFKGNAASEVAKKVLLQTDGKILVAFQYQYGQAMIARYLPDGTLDLSYANMGFSPVVDITLEDAVMGSEGKILLVGERSSDNQSNFVLVRYTNKGTFDSTFGKNGSVVTDFGGDDYARSAAIQGNGKIVVGGYTSKNGAEDFALARYKPDGTLDSTFSVDGKLTNNQSTNDRINAIAFQSDGQIIVAGSSYDQTTNQFTSVLARYRQDGNRDTKFGSSGWLTALFGDSGNINALAIQKDGKIVAAGNYYNRNIPKFLFAVARVNTDGTLDSSFSGDGMDTLDFGNYNEARSIAIQQDGKIVVGGVAFITFNTSDMALVRYDTNGTRDNTFSNDGKLTGDIGGNEEVNSLALQSDGKIIAGGQVADAGNNDIALARYLTNGIPDISFSSDGWLIDYVPIDVPVVYNCGTVQADGKILAAGYVQNKVEGSAASLDFAITRFNPDGSLDRTFSGDGIIATDFGGNDLATAIAVQKDGKIVVAGSTFAPGNIFLGRGTGGNFAVVRYNPDGTLDSTFNEDGKLTTDFGANDYITSMTLQADCKILVAGATSADSVDQSKSDFALARYTTNGTLDSTFSEDGKLTTDFGGYDYASAVLVQSDGRIIAAGTTYISYGFDAKIIVARYTKNGTLDSSFSDDGKLVSNFGFAWTNLGRGGLQGGIALQGDGKILIAGQAAAEDFYTGHFLLARIQTDGNLDSSFNGKGTLTIDFEGGDENARSVAVQPDGKIMVGGYAHGDANFTFALARVQANGSLDQSFADNGKQITDLPEMLLEEINSLVLYQHRAYVIGGDNFYPSTGVVAAYQLGGFATTLQCPESRTVSADTGKCGAIVKGLDPMLLPSNGISTLRYTYSGATTDSGIGTASGRFFNKGTTTVSYFLMETPEKNCQFTLTVIPLKGLCDGKGDNCDGVIVEPFITTQAPAMQQPNRPAGNGNLQVSVFPNPSHQHFSLSIASTNDQPISLLVVDALGRLMESRAGLPSKGRLEVGQRYGPGIYYLQVVQGSNSQILRLVKERE
jgi:uncharacterized delta-60 repeat protein